MELFYRSFGEGGPPLIILHGLFGSSDNWNTLAKVFATRFSVFAIDQRNHGQSPHSDAHNYALLVQDLHAFVDKHQLRKPVLIGHSMGGKTVMNFAVKYPEKTGAIVIVDIAPKAYPPYHDHILKGLQSVRLAHIERRGEADQMLSKHIAELSVRQFLLKNLTRRDDGTFAWKINLKALMDHIDDVQTGMCYSGTFDGPALFIHGSQSGYLQLKDKPAIQAIFPQAHFVTLPTGHWLHAEQPQAFSEAVIQFLDAI